MSRLQELFENLASDEHNVANRATAILAMMDEIDGFEDPDEVYASLKERMSEAEYGVLELLECSTFEMTGKQMIKVSTATEDSVKLDLTFDSGAECTTRGREVWPADLVNGELTKPSLKMGFIMKRDGAAHPSYLALLRVEALARVKAYVSQPDSDVAEDLVKTPKFCHFETDKDGKIVASFRGQFQCRKTLKPGKLDDKELNVVYKTDNNKKKAKGQEVSWFKGDNPVIVGEHEWEDSNPYFESMHAYDTNGELHQQFRYVPLHSKDALSVAIPKFAVNKLSLQLGVGTSSNSCGLFNWDIRKINFDDVIVASNGPRWTPAVFPAEMKDAVWSIEGKHQDSKGASGGRYHNLHHEHCLGPEFSFSRGFVVADWDQTSELIAPLTAKKVFVGEEKETGKLTGSLTIKIDQIPEYVQCIINNLEGAVTDVIADLKTKVKAAKKGKSVLESNGWINSATGSPDSIAKYGPQLSFRVTYAGPRPTRIYIPGPNYGSKRTREGDHKFAMHHNEMLTTNPSELIEQGIMREYVPDIDNPPLTDNAKILPVLAFSKVDVAPSFGTQLRATALYVLDQGEIPKEATANLSEVMRELKQRKLDGEAPVHDEEMASDEE